MRRIVLIMGAVILVMMVIATKVAVRRDEDEAALWDDAFDSPGTDAP